MSQQKYDTQRMSEQRAQEQRECRSRSNIPKTFHKVETHLGCLSDLSEQRRLVLAASGKLDHHIVLQVAWEKHNMSKRIKTSQILEIARENKLVAALQRDHVAMSKAKAE